MAAATKAAGFAAVLRLFLLTFGDLRDLWIPIVAVLATASMVYGAVAALVQRDVKRILAYSSIAHAGYAAIGVASASQEGLAATLWYLLTYAVSTITAFAAVIAIERRRRGEVSLVDLRGLGTESPALATFFGVALLSLAGIPGTAGFVGKLQVFSAGVAAGLEWLVIVGVVSSAIAAFFYLRLMGLMFLEKPAEVARETLNPSTGLSFAISAGFAFIVFLGIQPGLFLTLAERVAFVAR
jgi:NADH-quinone oxidoreductase subunit N